MSKKLGISLGRPGQGAKVPANADDFIRAAPPEPKLDPPPAPKPADAASVNPRPAKPKAKVQRVGPKGGSSTVLANGNQRFTISLDPPLYKAVRRRAFDEHIEMAELLRRAARAYLGLEEE